MQEKDLKVLQEAEKAGGLTKYKTYFKFSGPGWIQGAITLGGGSLAGSLFLGSIGGYEFLWLQPLAMILGIIMLSSISYVTLSTEKSPFQLIKNNISPALAWGWIIATIMANIVWCMPQFNLAQAAVKQNILNIDGQAVTIIVSILIFVAAFYINYVYQTGSKGVKYIENFLKLLIFAVIICFILVVCLLISNNQVPIGEIFSGLIPDFSSLFTVSDTLAPHVSKTGAAQVYWENTIIDIQRDKIIAAFATAVGINMTFMLPYSLLKKKWGKKHRGLAIFDLSIGLFIPFMIATSAILITAASQFHTQTADVFEKSGKINPRMKAAYNKIIDARIKHSKNIPNQDLRNTFPQTEKNIDARIEHLKNSLPQTEKNIAAMLANRDNFQLANTLEPLMGKFWAQIVFGLGVIGMAFSTIVTLMMINGFSFCEMLNKQGDKKTYLTGCFVAGFGGLLGPFLWTGGSKAALAIPTSVIGATLLPIAYLAFLLLMNSKKVLGKDALSGGRRIRWNVLMGISTIVASYGAVWGLLGKANSPDNNFLSNIAILGLIGLVILSVIGISNFLKKEKKN